MIELVRRAAGRDPERVAVVTDHGPVSYGEVLRRAEAAAAELARRTITRVALVDGDGAVVLALLAACSLAGVQLCQYPPDATPADVAGLAARFEHHVVITDRVDLDAGTALPAATLWSEDAPAGTPPPADRPLLVLTTGTTGAPRGVRHDWNRLLRGVAGVPAAPEQRWLLAYGLHQFAGLQIVLHVAAAGATLVAPIPRRPREGLAAMRAHGVTHASATPTYWRFLLAELRVDGGPTPDLAQITLGGEAVPAAVLAELRTVFPAARISQIYAASEFGSSSSMRDGRPGLSTEVLDRPDDAPVAMKVVDGELWVRSRTGMLGYHGEAAIDPDAWRPTGDLVEVVDDRILFRGRISEIINVGGIKVHPLPIEERVGAVPGVDMARVFGRPNAMTGAIVAVEIVAAPDTDAEELKAAVRAACADLAPAARPRSIRIVDSVAMTGNKIIRRTP